MGGKRGRPFDPQVPVRNAALLADARNFATIEQLMAKHFLSRSMVHFVLRTAHEYYTIGPHWRIVLRDDEIVRRYYVECEPTSVIAEAMSLEPRTIARIAQQKRPADAPARRTHVRNVA